MSDTSKTPPDSVPTEPTTLTDGLSQQVMSLTQKAAGSSSAKGSAWLLYVILAAVIAIGLGIMGWMMVAARRKAAELAFELRKKEEEQKAMVENQKLEQSKDVREQAEKQIKVIGEEIDGLKKSLKAKEAEAVARAATFANIASWDDIVIVDKRQ